MKKILLINTGGTIAMSQDQTTGKVSPTSDNPIHQQGHLLQNFADIDVLDFLNIPSPHMDLEKMLELSQLIQEKAKSYDGIVITHGTDTLEETAYFLELTLDLPIPIVVTGAMRSSNEIGSDGLANLRSAIFTAREDHSAQKGVLVVMNEEIHTATYVTKTHTTNLATFQTPTFGPIGILYKNQVTYFQELIRHEHYHLTAISQDVALLKVYAGMKADLFEAVLDHGYQGLVIEALGAGNLPPQIVPILEQFMEAQIPVVLVSRAFNGVTEDIYDYPGGGKRLSQMGVIFTQGLSGIKARIKLAVLLNAEEKVSIKQAFQGK
ncbi:asparaginase [Facklamia hominis]|uniref:asparaginase n=2 Tax=Facklamia hominis TaxID=178214 RepID=K1M1S3_9LACT|nr:asparaginase [Facklamia hominis]EKB56278.1 L-asparaginase, type II [Facklamia hominis CCUG 36813]EPH12692.1 L-asparaginase, type II [Facklamia hominis ACS-120-V-Sch10]MDK7186421.1 asparaginase [Facklamia hominis]PKY92366.1 asparaginase [Facklamia hominis]RYC98004.1 asparaginase [Facklamia hominis]